MTIYLKDLRVIAYFHQKASPDFWDAHWKVSDLRAKIISYTTDTIFIPQVKKYLPPGSLVLEGGCGQGQLVHALCYQGYQAVGVDFAEKTVHMIQEAVPDLNVRVGDVRHLSIPDETFDGYLSVGVIEHFWEGYAPIISEMARILKIGGFLFISFPYMSPLRKLKAMLHFYPTMGFQEAKCKQNAFYQFALNQDSVVNDLRQYGFVLKYALPFDGLKGFKDECPHSKRWLQPIYDGKTHRRLRPHLNRIFEPFASHCIMLVMQKIE